RRSRVLLADEMGQGMRGRLIQLAIVMCLGACAGCGSAATETAPGGLRGEIAFYTNEGPDELAGFRDLIATFEAAHAGVRINLVNMADEAGLDKKLAARFDER